jgi:hypothetical protein
LAGYANTAVQSVCRVTENNFSTSAAFVAIPFPDRALDWTTLHHQQTLLLNTALFIHNAALAPNVLGISLRQYQIYNQVTQRTHDQRRRRGLSRFQAAEAFSVFVTLGHFRHLSIIDIMSYRSKCTFICHTHLAQLVAPTSFSTFILKSNAIFFSLAIFNCTQ